ncbi:MAG: glycosyltransferase [Myxococcaceae bacterium]
MSDVPSTLKAAEPLVSVLMVTYNQEAYVAQAIEGVLLQRTDFPFELIIGEDASRDRTLDIALDYQRQEPNLIRVMPSSQNLGPHKNLQRVVEASRGQFLAACDGDDYWIAPDKLSRQVDVLRKRSDVSAVFTNFASTRLESGIWRVSNTDALTADALTSLRGSPRGKSLAGKLRTLTSVYRAEVYKTLYASSLPLETYPFLDSFLVAQALSLGEVEILDFRSAIYRESPQSATRSSPARNLAVLEGLRDFLGKFPEFFPKLLPISPAETREVDIAICKAAFMAGDASAYGKALVRLKETGLPVPSALRYLMPLMRWPTLRKLSIALRNLGGRTRTWGAGR